MPTRKLWTKLFTHNKPEDEIELHVSGATVRHKNPFENLEVPRNEYELPDDIVKEWVIPFYMTGLGNIGEATIIAFADAAGKINNDIVSKLLGDFNWRARIAGAYFASINNLRELDDIIGKHLLKSEVCYAGKGYCIALACFKTEASKQYLTEYLDYYLGREDLGFDQAEAFCALEHLDTKAAEARLPAWNNFVANKPYWNLENSRQHFNNNLSNIEKIRAAKME